MQGPQFGHHSHQSELRDDGPETELPEMVRAIVSKVFLPVLFTVIFTVFFAVLFAIFLTVL
jgi:hypothetical protein